MLENLISRAHTSAEMPTTKMNVITRIKIVTWWLRRQNGFGFIALRWLSLNVTTRDWRQNWELKKSSKISLYCFRIEAHKKKSETLNHHTLRTCEVCGGDRTRARQLVRIFGGFLCYAIRRRCGCRGRCCQRQILNGQNTLNVLHHLLLSITVRIEHKRVGLHSMRLSGRCCIRSIEILQVFDAQQQRVDALRGVRDNGKFMEFLTQISSTVSSSI